MSVSYRKNDFSGKAARIVWIAMYMQRKREFTTQEVKRDLGISQRGMMRYIATLREAGIVIDYERAQHAWKYYCWDGDMASIREMVG